MKVLDFGLAKPVETGSGTAADATHSPTIMTSPAMTLQGVILGTAGYMPPAQARGRPRGQPDGREVYYLAPNGDLMAVAVAFTGERPTFSAPQRLFATGLRVSAIQPPPATP